MIGEHGNQAVRAARQMVRTDQLLGVGFVPLPARRTAATDAAAGKQRLLDDLRARHDRECPHCTTATAHTQTVFGEGNPDARLVFVGEAPGAEEDRTGRPFVGRAGELLNKMIVAMGLEREEIYIANVLKSRPPNNATPTPAEVMKCAPYLAEQLKIIAPDVIVALGAPAAKFLLDTTEGISALRGSWHACRLGELEIPVMPTFHPAYLLRNYTPEARGKVWSDLQAVMKRLNESA
ncbi:MAG: uracil-DNA glycosylase [Phycisphaerales bacterium]|nr:uracil-DNA glycosylase [Phycisphaerales bacterium]